MRGWGMEAGSDPILHFAQAVEAIGTPRFNNKLIVALNQLAKADYLNIWIYSPREGMNQIGVASLADTAAARSLTRAYVGGYYKYDPNFSDMAKPRRSRKIIVRKLNLSACKSEEYKHKFFGQSELIDKIALIWHADHYSYNLNIYRLRGTPAYSDDDLRIVRSYSRLIVGIVRQHCQHFNVHKDLRSGRMLAFVQRVANVADPPLTQRELDVIGRIALGASAEAVALDLGIGFESVVTHRKRAYAKLGISSQGELFGLCINNVHHLLE
jgi:DNA-binding CsgD family transcriptional regulator